MAGRSIDIIVDLGILFFTFIFWCINESCQVASGSSAFLRNWQYVALLDYHFLLEDRYRPCLFAECLRMPRQPSNQECLLMSTLTMQCSSLPAATFFPRTVGTFARRRVNLTFRREAPTIGTSYFHTLPETYFKIKIFKMLSILECR